MAKGNSFLYFFGVERVAANACRAYKTHAAGGYRGASDFYRDVMRVARGVVLFHQYLYTVAEV